MRIESDYDYRYERKALEPIELCFGCTESLYKGDVAYKLEGHYYCQNCISKVEVGEE